MIKSTELLISVDGAPYVVCTRVDTHLGVSGRNLYMKS